MELRGFFRAEAVEVDAPHVHLGQVGVVAQLERPLLGLDHLPAGRRLPSNAGRVNLLQLSDLVRGESEFHVTSCYWFP